MLRAPGKVKSEELPERLPARYAAMYPLATMWGGDWHPYRVDTPMAQIGLCLDVEDVLACNKAAFLADIVAQNEFSATDVSQFNAFQHILLAANLTAFLGPVDARAILDAHENIRGGTPFGPWDEARMMDLINNEVGIDIGVQMIDQDDSLIGLQEAPFLSSDALIFREPVLAQATYQAIVDGRAVWLDEPLVPLPKRDTPSR
jgi:hypothetical protein